VLGHSTNSEKNEGLIKIKNDFHLRFDDGLSIALRLMKLFAYSIALQNQKLIKSHGKLEKIFEQLFSEASQTIENKSLGLRSL